MLIVAFDRIKKKKKYRMSHYIKYVNQQNVDC